PSAQRTDLGTVHPGDLFPEAVDQAVFALPAPGVTEPVQSPLGWHLLNVSEITPAATIPFEQAQERLRQEIARELAVDALYDLSNRFQDALAGGATLEEAAQQLNLKPVEIAAVDHSGLDKAGAPAEGLPPIPVFLQTVCETAERQVSPLGETPDGGYFALRVDAVEPQRERALDEVRDRVDAAWRAEQARKLALAEAEKLAEQARAGEELAAIAEARNLSVQVSPPFTRGTNRPADRLPASLVEKLFAAAPGAVVVDQMADGAIVARLTEIEAADP